MIDATCGGGRDTLALARLVQPWAGGQGGRVQAIDIQEDALARTRSLLHRELGSLMVSASLRGEELGAMGHWGQALRVRLPSLSVYASPLSRLHNRAAPPTTTVHAPCQALRKEPEHPGLALPRSVLAAQVLPARRDCRMAPA